MNTVSHSERLRVPVSMVQPNENHCKFATRYMYFNAERLKPVNGDWAWVVRAFDRASRKPIKIGAAILPTRQLLLRHVQMVAEMMEGA